MEDEHYKVPSGLYRWDIFGGKKPEFLGLFGTKDRVQTYTDSFIIDKERDILYSVSTNHSYGSPDLIAIDLSGFRNVMYEKGEVCEDMLIYAPGYPEYHPFAEHWQSVKEQIAKYAPGFRANKITPVRLWKEFSGADINNARVTGLRFIDNNTLKILCGDKEKFVVTVKDGKILSIKTACNEEIKDIIKIIPEPEAQMPYYPGRQWKCAVSAMCEWTDGSKLVGTEDGFLAIICKGKKVYSLGPAICQGPVRGLCSDLKAGVAYGVGGDVEDVGNIFKYTDEEGLSYLGCMICDTADNDVGVCANFVLSSCALSPDGTKLAIGAMDRLSCVYICDI